MRASAELRKILDVGEQHLQTLMNQLEQVVNPAPEKRKPEPSKIEAIRGLDESAGGVKRAL
jgi:hypothetical protein